MPFDKQNSNSYGLELHYSAEIPYSCSIRETERHLELRRLGITEFNVEETKGVTIAVLSTVLLLQKDRYIPQKTGLGFDKYRYAYEQGVKKNVVALYGNVKRFYFSGAMC